MQLLPLLRLSHAFLCARNGASHPSERRGNPLVVGRLTLVLSKEPLLKLSSSILNLMPMWAFMVARGAGRGTPFAHNDTSICHPERSEGSRLKHDQPPV